MIVPPMPYFTINGSPELVSLNIENLVDKMKRGKATSGRKRSIMDCALLLESVFLLSEKPVCSFEGHLDDVLDLSSPHSHVMMSQKNRKLYEAMQELCVFSSSYVNSIMISDQP